MVYITYMLIIDRNCQRVRITVLDVFGNGKTGKSRNITIYNATCDEVYEAIGRLPEMARKASVDQEPAKGPNP